ncbi:hypothetical protein ACFRSX_32690 [Streptomyces goshikiensis]|uniref:hypothetical protein n=1 Tax=Streptomyces TaxID=1883 RepID=UPI000C27E875|nr:hypothetical protein [Streptomyces sp. CB02120-2]PJN14541.1 hypothetical protein CG724_33140 [Streptomyces sp. CB02120-2]
MLNVQPSDTRAGAFTVSWTPDDDPDGHLLQALTSGHLESALEALADPVKFGETSATDTQALARLRSVQWMLDRLERRRGALLVALRDRRATDPAAGASWADLAKALYPEDPDPQRLRSKVQTLHAAGLKKAGRHTG